MFNSFNSVASFYAFEANRATEFLSFSCETNLNNLGSLKFKLQRNSIRFGQTKCILLLCYIKVYLHNIRK